MNKTSALKIVNPILAILLLAQLLTGISGPVLPRDWFILLHQGGGLLLAIAAALHVFLNWSWIKATFFTPRSTPDSRI
jgi:heme A synthase